MADAVVDFFKKQRGITHFKVEEPIHKDLAVPTLHAKTQDHHIICVEFSEATAYPLSVERFVPDCNRLSLPVRVFVAIPSGSNNPNHTRDLNRSREWGVGVLVVDGADVTALQEPLSLSLASVRRIDMRKFPGKYRFALSQAETTFRQGNPAKGCSEVYDEIEALTRRIAKRTSSKGMWKASKTGKAMPTINLDKDPWANVIEVLMTQLDSGTPPDIPKTLWAQILGITPLRNETGHKPKSKDTLIRRDTTLKTRFENAADILLDLINASKSLRV
jgi:hypothetical protein